MEADDVRLGQQRAEVVGPAEAKHAVAPKASAEASGLAADPARADDEQLLAVEARPEHELERELPLVSAPDEPVPLGDAPEEREHQTDRELRRRRVRTSGVFATTTPRAAAAARSMLFTPTA